MPEITELHKQLLNHFQKDFPLSSTPYADIAAQLNVTEAEVLIALRELSESEIVSRVGAVFRPHRVGASTLAAIAVPMERFEEVADMISALPEVNHNYEREHHFNLWFVVTATSESHLQAVLSEIEEKTRLSVMVLPMEADYHIDLGFELQWHGC